MAGWSNSDHETARDSDRQNCFVSQVDSNYNMQFPFEIWKKIVSYLPVQEVKKLYAVNNALFRISMDLRYQEARLSSGSKAFVRKNLRVFRYVIFQLV